MPAKHAHRRGIKVQGGNRLFWGWFAYVVFIIYGSLLPFDYTPLIADSAVEAFLNTPFLHLGIESRADWIANGVLYLPLGFLTLSWFKAGKALSAPAPYAAMAMFFCLLLAFGVEFAQLYFPPRTVSRNDIIAEVIGSFIGVALAYRGDAWLHTLLKALSERLGDVAIRLLQIYVVAYLFFSLFPFDFLISVEEFKDKLVSANWGWLIAPSSLERGLIPLAAKLLAEVLCIMPLGMLPSHTRPLRLRPTTALLAGMGIGLSIEIAQFFIFSGVSEGLSILTRGLGIIFGTWLWEKRQRWPDLPEMSMIRRLKPPLTLLYLLMLAAVNGWFSHRWLGLSEAADTLTQTRFIPLYYHYYTTEQAALVSLTSVALMYLPLGLLTWLNRQPPRVAFWLAAIVAMPIETGKLFLSDLHPDPTNLLIATLSAWGTAALIKHLTRLEASHPAQRTETPSGEPPETPHAANPRYRELLAAGLSLACAGWVSIDFPYHPLLLAGLLLAYATTIWHRPRLIWFFIPATLPLLDFAPWSGRFYWDEFDYLLLISIVIAWSKVPTKSKPPSRDLSWEWALGLLAALFALGALRGLAGLDAFTPNTFSSYYSPFNGLRQAKGVFAALLLAVLWRRFAQSGHAVEQAFSFGMIFGLAGVGLSVIWERAAFPGLFAFSDPYRVTGPFSAMHVGGADLESYLTCSIPFALLMLKQAKARWHILAVTLCLVAAAYATMVSFSRIGYLGFIIAVGSATYLLWFSRGFTRNEKPPTRGRQPRWMLWGGLFAGLICLAAVPFMAGDFAIKRFAMTGSDLSVRLAHWADALAIRDSGIVAETLGSGLGRYPEIHLWRSSETKASSFQLMRETNALFLRLGTGSPSYIEQVVDLRPNRQYMVEMDIRSSEVGARATILLCEKWLLTSANCIKTHAEVQASSNWEHVSVQLDSGQLSATPWPFKRPIKLSIINESAESIDIDNVRLIDESGSNLIANHDFSAGMDRWFFSVDLDLPWHVWSLPVAILFDLGWIGVLLLAVLAAAALSRMLGIAQQGNMMAAAAFSASLGILPMGLMDTIIDAPRLSLLLILLMAAGSTRLLPPSKQPAN